MKKFLSIILVLIMMLASMPIMAEEFDGEIDFDVCDASYEANDEIALMAVEDSVKEELEKRLVEAWSTMPVDDPETEDNEERLIISDLEIDASDIVAVYQGILREHPKFYYVLMGFSGAKIKGTTYMGYIVPKYSETDKSVIEATWAQLDKATEEILFYISSDMTDFEKVMTVHDYMVNNYVYDIEDTDQTMLIMLDKVGVCAAYSEAFVHVMNVLGIEASVATSDEMGHMWNMVKVDDRWYHIDVTWDDPVPDQLARVSHKYAFLSEKAIGELGHTGFTAPYYAASTKYNNADWRDDGGAIVTVNGVMYRVEGNDLIGENGNVIYKNLDGNDGKWHVSETGYVADVIWTGLCEINGVLYFNTDTGIYSYNPETGETECMKEEYGIGGIYADKNVIVYNTYDFEAQAFVKKGEIKICGSYLKEAVYDNGKAVVRFYNDYDVPVWIISSGEGYMIHKVDSKSAGVAQFENGTEQTIYIWKDSLEPVIEPFTVSE